MSYKLPFSDPAGRSVIRVILLALIGLHGLWIVIHMNLVSRELINPWKLGGYGMYTTANNDPVIFVFDARMDTFAIPITAKDRAKMARANKFFVFRCNPITTTSLQGFLKDNPRFVGVPLRFVFTERKMYRDPLRPERVPYSILEIRWTGQSTFDYAGKACDKLYNGQAELKL